MQARYSHITPAMTDRLLAGLTEQWESALRERAAVNAGSPVGVLDRLLKVVAGEPHRSP